MKIYKNVTSEISSKMFTYKKVRDVFDENLTERKFMSQYFGGLELMLRTAILVEYKNYLLSRSPVDVKKFDNEIKQKTDPKTFLKKITDVFDYTVILKKWYEHFDVDKTTDEHIKKILLRYINAENVLFNRLYKKYVDSNWKEDKKMWFAECKRSFGKSKPDYLIGEDGYVVVEIKKKNL